MARVSFRYNDPIPAGVGVPSQQFPQGSPGQQGYLQQLPVLVGTILFYPDSQAPTFIGVNKNPNANPTATNWKIYTITYNPANPGFYTSITARTDSWASLGVPY